MNSPHPDAVPVPPHCAAHADCFRRGYQSARRMSGGYRVNLVQMRYEPEDPMEEPELAAWTEGFRAGFLARRSADEPN